MKLWNRSDQLEWIRMNFDWIWLAAGWEKRHLVCQPSWAISIQSRLLGNLSNPIFCITTSLRALVSIYAFNLALNCSRIQRQTLTKLISVIRSPGFSLFCQEKNIKQYTLVESTRFAGCPLKSHYPIHKIPK